MLDAVPKTRLRQKGLRGQHGLGEVWAFAFHPFGPGDFQPSNYSLGACGTRIFVGSWEAMQMGVSVFSSFFVFLLSFLLFVLIVFCGLSMEVFD